MTGDTNENSAPNFKGRTALVTGGSKGLGKAIVKALYDAGCKVITFARSTDLLKSLENELPGIVTATVDLSDSKALQHALEAHDDIDFLVNNAGIMRAGSLLNATIEDFSDSLAVNLIAPFICMQHVAKNLIKKGKNGSIVNISSVQALRPALNRSSYAASKNALDMLTKTAAVELGPHQIRCNSVQPTIVWTDMTRSLYSDPPTLNKIIQKIPLRHVSPSEAVVQPILFLLSDQAAMITGTNVPIDGGLSVGFLYD